MCRLIVLLLRGRGGNECLMDGLECARTAGLAGRAGITVAMTGCTFCIVTDTTAACRQAMCRCAMGGSASIAQRGEEFQRNAKLTFQMWQNQGQPYSSSAQPPGDIPIPQLLRKSLAEPPAVLAAPGAYSYKSHPCNHSSSSAPARLILCVPRQTGVHGIRSS